MSTVLSFHPRFLHLIRFTWIQLRRTIRNWSFFRLNTNPLVIPVPKNLSLSIPPAFFMWNHYLQFAIGSFSQIAICHLPGSELGSVVVGFELLASWWQDTFQCTSADLIDGRISSSLVLAADIWQTIPYGYFCREACFRYIIEVFCLSVSLSVLTNEIQLYKEFPLFSFVRKKGTSI